ncbi:hypothetical protein V2K50_19385 [Pseudomonas alliivorans]|uniref:hypothetical protein n=1 Tax=Pseudomonas alliivorans TaxID=2810613 RepID=UPI002EC3B48E|nr:hypothetical protein [Pseudomonas alliivorans]MEE4910418.1 hypothetical protein [Pseudomonas alliivorans]MEE5122010.1 hypothetical protein [Pseudomonas alliivorans]
MDELNHHLQQLPNFLQAELAAHIGSLSGLEYTGITERYIHTAHHLINSKRAPLQQAHIDNVRFMWGDVRATKLDMENKALLRSLPGGGQTDFYSMTVDADFHLQSIRFLNEFKAGLESLHGRLKEQQRQHTELVAQEAARRAAENAARARMQAEEAARRMAEEHAAQQRAREAALQLAQRQTEEAAREVTRRKAEEALRLASESARTAKAMLGPEATKEIGVALNALKNAIEFAVTECSNALSAQGVSNTEHFEAVGKMNVFD